MFRGDLISQAVTGHFGGLVGDGICFGKPPHHLKLNSLVVNLELSFSNPGTEFFDFAQKTSLKRYCDSV